MQLAIEAARERGSVYGAVLAMGNQSVVSASDAPDEAYDPLGHAILRALRELGRITHEQHFPGYRLYSTVEPCSLCATASAMTRLEGIYYGMPGREISDQRHSGLKSAKDILSYLSASTEIKGEILAGECRDLL